MTAPRTDVGEVESLAELSDLARMPRKCCSLSVDGDSKRLKHLAGGGGRTRTYEGLASGFTVRPLCHSGHSPVSAGSSLADENAPGWPRRFAVRLMLPHGSACQLEICR